MHWISKRYGSDKDRNKERKDEKAKERMNERKKTVQILACMAKTAAGNSWRM